MENDLGLQHLVAMIAGDVPVVSASSPEPALRALNVIATFDTDDSARNGVLGLESIDTDDSAIGLVSIGSGHSASDPAAEDTAIARDTLPRLAKGALMGAAVGAVLVGLGVALFGDDSSAGIVAGGAIGGALFGAFIGAVWGAFARFGGSDAYRQSFAPNDAGLTFVSLHTNDPDEAREAMKILGLQSSAIPMIYRREGTEVWADDAFV